MWRAFFIQHSVGMVGQIAAGLPLLIVTALISHTHGLALAGQFTVVVGISAAVYSISLWEIRSYLVLRGFDEFSPLDYAATRGVALIAATIVAVYAALWMGISFPLAIAVALFRICDGVFDLAFGFNTAFRELTSALRAYAIQHVLKLSVLCTAGVLALLIDPNDSELFVAASGLTAATGAVAMIIRELRRHSSPLPKLSSIARLLFRARWFALATLGVVMMTTAPRIVAAWLYHGDMLGVVGVSLSITSFFGIAFFTTWVRYLPRFKGTRNGRMVARHFIFENISISVIAAFVSFFILPSFTAMVFGIRDPGQLAISREVLVAGVLFFGSMSLANLYKVTATPWMEFIVYLASFIVVGAFTFQYPVFRNMTAILVIAGLTMIGMSVFAWRGLRPAQTPDSSG